MIYNFDEVIPRNHTRSYKWDFRKDGGKVVHWDGTDPINGADQILPMWLADMDFPSPQPVEDALAERVRHGVYGYTYADDALHNSVVNWMQKRHNWDISADWVRVVPAGIVPGLHMLVQTYVKPGEKVLIQPPVYYPFSFAIANNGGEVVNNPLIYERGSYYMDYEDLERKTADPSVKMAILCSPHNPVGRVWTREELCRFAEICLRNDVLIIADEVHCDLTYNNVTFVPFCTLGQEVSEKTVVCNAPSKTFNLAGLQTSNLIFPGEALRARFDHTLKVLGLFGLNPFSALALETAYNEGDEWLDQLMTYIQSNYGYMDSYFAEHLPQLSTIQPEATYLVWFDCRGLGLGKDALEDLMFNKAKIYFDEGYIFGEEGEGFERINIACPRAILVDAMERIRKAIDTLN